MLSKEGKRSIAIHSVLLAVWIGLMVLATFKDLDISKALSNGNSIFGQFFAVFAEWPAYIILPFSSIVLFYNVDNMTSNKRASIALKILFALMYYGGVFMFYSHSEQFDDMANLYPMAIGYALVVATPTLYFCRYVNKDTIKKLLKFAVFALIVLAVSRLLVTIIKLFWSRARFRDMLAVSSFETFTPWYQPNGIRKIDGFQLTSFPSGHVTSATNIFVIVVLCDIFPKLKNKKWIFYLASSIFVALAMLARVVYNAHFLSDTLVAVFISYLTFYITKLIFFRDKKYVYDLDKKENLTVEDAENINIE